MEEQIYICVFRHSIALPDYLKTESGHSVIANLSGLASQPLVNPWLAARYLVYFGSV